MPDIAGAGYIFPFEQGDGFIDNPTGLVGDGTLPQFTGDGKFGMEGDGDLPLMTGAGVLDIALSITGAGVIPGFRQPTSGALQLDAPVVGAGILSQFIGAGVLSGEGQLAGDGDLPQLSQQAVGIFGAMGGAGKLSLSGRFSSTILKFARE